MNSPSKRRGRPKSSETLEKERIDEILSAGSPALKITPEQAKEQNEIFESHKKILRDLHAQFSPTIPRKLIEEYASLHDESTDGYEQKILANWEKAHEELSIGQKSGGRETAKKATERTQTVWSKNQDLARRIAIKNLSVTGASTIIFNEWDKRGDGRSKPSIRTISNWYKRK